MIKQGCNYMNFAWKFLHGHEVGKLTIWSKQKWKNAWTPSGEIPKEFIEGFGDSTDSKEFVDPQCQPSVNVDPMDVKSPSSSRARSAVNKGKGLESGVHLFKPICKKPRKMRLVVQEMSDSLKSISDVIVESRSVSTRTPCDSKATAKLKSILDMVLSLPGVQPGDRLHLFSTLFFMEKVKGRHIFVALGDNKDVQLKWLER